MYHRTAPPPPRREISEPKVQSALMDGVGLVCAPPVIRRPDDGCFRREEDPQDLSARHTPQRMPKTPDLVAALHRIHYIALERRFNSIKANAIVAAAHQ